MTSTGSKLPLKKIFFFWLPLAATWLMMSFEGPFLSALIARLDEPKFNLAAYGVAFAFALIIEAPVIMMMSASTALVKDKHSYHKLKSFTYLLNTALTLLMIILIIPPVFYFITEDLIGLPENISYLTHLAVTILIPWPAAIGYRRFYQGILIRNNLTRRVAYGTIIRLITMSLTAVILFSFFDVPGVVVAASALSMAVIAEATASRFMTNSIITKIKKDSILPGNELTYKDIYKFYYPLALTSLITLGVQPFVTFFVGQSRMAIESLAVLPVVTSFVFIFRALGLSFQEVVIAQLGDDKCGYIPLRNFALLLGGTLTAILAIISFSPLADLWFNGVSGLSLDLAEFAKLPLKIMVVFPALTVLISFQRAALVNTKRTKPITLATSVEFVIIVIAMLFTIKIFGIVGAVAAAISFVLGRISSNTYLTPYFLKSVKR